MVATQTSIENKVRESVKLLTELQEIDDQLFHEVSGLLLVLLPDIEQKTCPDA